jgi:hypothetical protein
MVTELPEALEPATPSGTENCARASDGIPKALATATAINFLFIQSSPFLIQTNQLTRTPDL